MNRLNALAIAMSTLVLATANQACAVSPAVVADAAQTAPASTPRFSIDTKFSELVADPQAREVIGAFFEKRRIAANQPAMSEEESAGLMQMIGDLTPRELSNFPQANLDDAALEELNQALAALPAPQ